ncbi:MAG: hypothetical protein Ta2D_06220 [Rickettsiales bacterium]|nr:MAG: hypothetical protein Ta2D_06220 [Rickettsiales bacterium]
MEKNNPLPPFYKGIMNDMLEESYTEPEETYIKVGDISFIKLLSEIEKETNDSSYFSNLSLNELDTRIGELRHKNITEPILDEIDEETKDNFITSLFSDFKKDYKLEKIELKSIEELINTNIHNANDIKKNLETIAPKINDELDYFQKTFKITDELNKTLNMFKRNGETDKCNEIRKQLNKIEENFKDKGYKIRDDGLFATLYFYAISAGRLKKTGLLSLFTPNFDNSKLSSLIYPSHLYQKQKNQIKPVLDKTGNFIIEKMSYKMAFNFLNEWKSSCNLKNEDAVELEKILYNIFSKEPTEQNFKKDQETLKDYLNRIKDKYNSNNSKKMPGNYFMQFNPLCNANNLNEFKNALKNEFYNQTKLLVLKQNNTLLKAEDTLDYPKGTRNFSNNAVFFTGLKEKEDEKGQLADDFNKNGENKTKINARVTAINGGLAGTFTNKNLHSVTLDFKTAKSFTGEERGASNGNITISTQSFSDSYYATIFDRKRWSSYKELIVNKQNQHDIIGNLILDYKNDTYTFKVNETFFPRNKEEQERFDDITGFFKTPKKIEEIDSHFAEYNKSDILKYEENESDIFKCHDDTKAKNLAKEHKKANENERNKKILRQEYKEARKHIDTNVEVEQLESTRQSAKQLQTNPKLQEPNENPKSLPIQNIPQPAPKSKKEILAEKQKRMAKIQRQMADKDILKAKEKFQKSQERKKAQPSMWR